MAANLVLALQGAEPILCDRKARRPPLHLWGTAMLPNTIPPRTGRTRSPEVEEYLALWEDPPRGPSHWALGSCTRFHGTRTGRVGRAVWSMFLGIVLFWRRD